MEMKGVNNMEPRGRSLVQLSAYGVSCLIIFILLFHGAYSYLFNQWLAEDFNYCFLVPVIVLYLLWEKRDKLRLIQATPSWVGLVPLLLGICIYSLGELGGEYYAIYLSSWLLLLGSIWIHSGWPRIKATAFPIFFLIAMFPFPGVINNNLTLQLKLFSSQLGVLLMQWYGLSAYREGNVIDLGFTQLQVVDACSGLRYLFPLLVMGILLAYFYRAALWKRILLVLSTVPLTITTNSLRIAMTGILYEMWGPQVAEDFFHGFSGWLIFMFGLAVLLGEMWVLNGFRGLGLFGGLGESKDKLATDPHGFTPLNGLEASPKEDLTGQAQTFPAASSEALLDSAEAAAKETAISHSTLNPETLNVKPAAVGWKSLLHPPQFIVAVALLAATLAAAQGIEFREKIPPAKSFALFPLQVGDWVGKRDVMEEKFVKELDLSDYVIVDYVNGSRAVNFYTAYYESQRKGESIHSPETCLPGAGWEFKKAGTVTLPIQTRRGEPMTVNKAFMEQGAAKQLSYFWFPQRDRVLTNAWELKIYNFWDALRRQRTDGALVRLVTPVYPHEDAAQAEARLTAFTQAIVPVLNEFLPK